MSTATVTLSTKGQVVIPKDIRDALHWEAGTELAVIPAGNGVMLKLKRKKGPHTLADLIGFLQYDGPPISTEELCRPVDLNEEPNGTSR